MERARLEEIWSRFLAGERLAREEEIEIADALDADPRLLAELASDLKLDRSLLGIGRAGLDEDAFMESFSYRLRTERDGTRFMATVKQKMKRSRKPPTRRWQTSPWTGTRVAVAAAVLLVFAGLLLVASSTREPGKKSDLPGASLRRPVDRNEQAVPEAPKPPPAGPPSIPVENAPASIPNRAPAPPLPPGKQVEPLPPAPPTVVVENQNETKPDPVRATVGTPARALVVACTVTRVNGDASAVSAEGRTPVKTGQKLHAGQGLEAVGAKSGVQVQFADGTRLELGPDTILSELAEAEGPKGRGKRIVLARGVLNADVTKQPSEQPLIISTPHGEAKVLGTVFRLSVEPGASGSVRLDVKEGKVRLTRASDQKSVDIPAGCYAATGTGGDFDLNSEHKVTVSFQDGVSPAPRYSGTSDTTLLEAAKLVDKNLGTSPQIWVDGDTTVGDDRYILIRWDLTSLPARATVLSATIDVQVTNDSRGSAFELYELKRDWVEKEATWKSAASKVPWQAPGAQGPQDRGAALLGLLAPQKAGAYTIRLTPEGVAALQSWIDQPASNRGLIIANTDNADAVGLHSREATLPANRPRLNVTFVPRTKDATPK